MKERAKQALLELKEKNKDLSEAFDAYVKKLAEELEIPESIAVTLVTTELVNANERKLILHDLFSKTKLDEVKL